jgi:hypothetical protein
MLESLLSIESLLAVSIGALFSFKISSVNVRLRSESRYQSPDVQGNNNIIIYNNAMEGVRKEMAGSVRNSVSFQ